MLLAISTYLNQVEKKDESDKIKDLQTEAEIENESEIEE